MPFTTCKENIIVRSDLWILQNQNKWNEPLLLNLIKEDGFSSKDDDVCIVTLEGNALLMSSREQNEQVLVPVRDWMKRTSHDCVFCVCVCVWPTGIVTTWKF